MRSEKSCWVREKQKIENRELYKQQKEPEKCRKTEKVKISERLDKGQEKKCTKQI